MRVFNAIQMVVLLMAAPTLLSLCWNAQFTGARPLFWVGSLGTLALAVWNMALVYEANDD